VQEDSRNAGRDGEEWAILHSRSPFSYSQRSLSFHHFLLFHFFTHAFEKIDDKSILLKIASLSNISCFSLSSYFGVFDPRNPVGCADKEESKSPAGMAVHFGFETNGSH
jgi:hypothetical protein